MSVLTMPQTARGLFALALAVALGSLWLGAIVITLLPEGSLALHMAAALSILVGLGCAVALVIHGFDRLGKEERQARR